MPRAIAANTGIDRRDVLDVAGQHEIGADRGGERLDPLAERVALIGEGELRPVRGERPGDAPGDRVVVGDPHDQPALAVHQPVHASDALCRCHRVRIVAPDAGTLTHPAA